MFYEQVVLAKKGPLGHVWLAAHWEKKITKQQVNETNIVETVEQIRNPRAKMALRLSGHLLLGVVRIYFRKVDYLYTDCNEALGKLKKLVFRPGTVNIDESVTNLRNVTMPETVGDFEVVLSGDISTQQLPDIEEGVFSMNLGKVTDITLAPDALEQMRGDDHRLTLDQLPQPEPSLPSEIDLMDQNAPPDIVLPDEDVEAPLVEPGFEYQDLLGEGWAAEEPVELAIPDLPERAPAPRGVARRRRGIGDRVNELTDQAIFKFIKDPTPLLRNVRGAPASRKELEQSQLNLTEGQLGIFNVPNMSGIAPELVTVMRQTLKAATEVDIQLSIETSGVEDRSQAEERTLRRESVEQMRGHEGGEEFYHDYGGGDMFPDETPELPLPAPTAVEEREEREESEEKEVVHRVTERRGPTITKNTKGMHDFLAKKFSEAGPRGSLSFQNLFAGKSAHAAAIGFFELLNIKSKNCVELKQTQAYGDIMIRKTNAFNALTA